VRKRRIGGIDTLDSISRKYGVRRGREEEMTEKPEERVEKEETFIAPQEVVGNRVRNWIESGEKWGEGSSGKERTQEPKQEKVTEKGRRGRPTKAESIGRGRRDSSGSIVSLLSKRDRRSDSGSGEEGEEEKNRRLKRAKAATTSTTEENTNKEMEMEKIEEIMRKQKEDIIREMKTILITQREEMVKELKKELREEVRIEVKKEMNKEIERVREEEKNARKRLEGEIEKMRKIIEDSEKRRRDQESRERRLNIVVRGEKIEGGKVIDAVRSVLERMGMKDKGIKVKEAFKLKSREDDSLILVKLYSMDEKRMIMENKFKLKGTNVFVDDDMTKSERDRQSAMRMWAKIERAKGMNVKIGFGRAWMNGREYVWNEERKCMNEKNF